MAKNSRPTIAIIGNGMVGSTLAHWFKDALIFDVDPQRSRSTMAEINKQADVVFVAVPTPYNHGFDLSLVQAALTALIVPKTVVIKSTIVPGTTDQLQKEFPQHTILFNPEFLTEKTAVHDFLHPEMQIVGYTGKSEKQAENVLKLLPPAKVMKIMTAANAEAIKYFRNCFYATKVVFANQFYDFCQAKGLDYETVKEVVEHDPMVGPNHLTIFHQGGRGAGGKCLPKDLAAFTDLSQLPLLKKVREINKQYLAASKKK